MKQTNLLGWRALRKSATDRPKAEPTLIVAGPFRWVRHPQYLATLLMIWSSPDLTTDRLLFDVTWSVWMLVGMRLEERDLIEKYGDVYRDYRKRVPMLLPHRSGMET
jgi:protein-S-isoprenylcysteine O-methyltransferase Ste14